MNSQKSHMLGSKSLITSDERIFPSLHPLGPRYSTQNLLQKRPFETLSTSFKGLQPQKKVHVSNVDRENLSSRDYVSKENQIVGNPNLVIPRSFQSQPRERLGLLDLEDSTMNVLQSLAVFGFQNELQLLPLLFNDLQQMMMLTQVQQLSELLTSSPERFEDSAMLETKLAEKKNPSSDSSTNDSDDEEVEEKLPQSAACSLQNNESFTLSEIKPNESGMDCYSNISINIPLSETVVTSLDNIDEVMAGFSDKLESKVPIGNKFQTALPAFELGNNQASLKNILKPVWIPNEEKTEKVDILMNKIEETLEIKMSNQEKACKLLRENSFVIEDCLDRITKSKTRYRTAFKTKKNFMIKQRK